MFRLYACLSALLLFVPIRAEANEGSVHQPSEGADKRKQPVHIPSRISKLRGLVVAWCDEITRDGRSQPIAAIAVSLQERDAVCPACREFFKLVATQCTKEIKTPKAPKKPKTPTPAPAGEGEEDEVETATPTPLPTPLQIHLQREPSIEVVQATLDLFSAMQEDTSMTEFYLTVVDRLLSHLRNQEGRLPGERDYLDNLAHYVEAPFRERLMQRSAHPELLPTVKAPVSEEQKEQFFDF